MGSLIFLLFVSIGKLAGATCSVMYSSTVITAYSLVEITVTGTVGVKATHSANITTVGYIGGIKEMNIGADGTAKFQVYFSTSEYVESKITCNGEGEDIVTTFIGNIVIELGIISNVRIT